MWQKSASNLYFSYHLQKNHTEIIKIFRKTKFISIIFVIFAP